MYLYVQKHWLHLVIYIGIMYKGKRDDIRKIGISEWKRGDPVKYFN